MQTYFSSSHKKTYFILLIIVIALAIFWLQRGSTSQQPNNSSETAKPDKSVSTPQAVNHNRIENKPSVTPAKADKKVNIPATTETVEKSEKTTAWEMASGKDANPSMPLNERVSEYAAIAVQRPENLPKVGDQVVLPMLHGETVTINVQSVTTNANGDYSWSGHLQGHSDDYPVIITYGENSIFAMITTPKGSYSMESVNGSGWLYKNPSEVELTKPNTKDYLVPTITE